MKKSLFNVLTAVAAIFSLAACSVFTPNSKQEIRIETTEYSISAAGGEIEVKFVPVLAWTATCEEEWLTFSPASGDATEEEVVMTLSVTSNGLAMRAADIVLSTETGNVHLTVVQEAADLSSIFEQTEFEAPIEGDEIKVKFIPPTDWTVECEEDWVSFSPESGTASTRKKTITISVDSNAGGKAREAIVYVVFEDGEMEITINQAGESAASPSDPDDPSKPDNPSDPDNPNTPDNPSDPDNPSGPDNPSDPDNPSNPDDPNKPDAPENQEGQAGTEDVNKGDDIYLN